MRRDHRDILRSVKFLSEAPTWLLEDISKEVEVIETKADHEIFADGSKGDALYFIAEGRVRLEKHGDLLLSRGPGEYFGEMALIDDTPRSAGAVADTDVVLLRWCKEDFTSMLCRDGRFAYQVCRALSAKIRESVESTARYQQDVRRALEVQRAMFPPQHFRNEFVHLEAYCLQAARVGGDFYDYMEVGENEFLILIADAQGHGFEAALLVAMIKTRLHSQIVKDRSPGQVMNSLNTAISKNLNSVRTATGCAIVVNGKTRDLQYCSAGHPPQYHYVASADEIRKLTAANVLLGVPGLGDREFKTFTESWSRDDFLVLYTDGLTEAKNEGGEEFGQDRLERVLWTNRRNSVGEIQQAVLEKLHDFRGDRDLEDDVTLVVLGLS